eukprot:3185574-Rhodomonas_salina.4
MASRALLYCVVSGTLLYCVVSGTLLYCAVSGTLLYCAVPRTKEGYAATRLDKKGAATTAGSATPRRAYYEISGTDRRYATTDGRGGRCMASMLVLKARMPLPEYTIHEEGTWAIHRRFLDPSVGIPLCSYASATRSLVLASAVRTSTM